MNALAAGDGTLLSGKNLAVYEKCLEILAETVTEDMTPLEKERALHDYMTENGRYDPEASSNDPNASPDPDNDNPYGFLINGVGICYGYARTFQLLMDLTGIECVTVEAQSVASGGSLTEHAWNMVCLDGKWYCVDVTWDDPSGWMPNHTYFNQTSDFFRQTGHVWDEELYPTAD